MHVRVILHPGKITTYTLATALRLYNMDDNRIKRLIRDLIIEIGEDPTREGLRETPDRIANMYKEIYGGYESDAELSVQFSEDSDTVVATDIQFYSMCEHHMLPFYGKIHIAYSPAGRVFGISKLVRLVEKYSRRLQIQERLTKNVADELYAQGVKGVAVMADGEHMCMKMRGVRNDAVLSSSAFRGVYADKSEREDIVAHIRSRSPSNGVPDWHHRHV